MNNTRLKLEGLDAAIQEIQTDVYNFLNSQSNTISYLGNISMYGRVYKNYFNRNKEEKGYKAEWWNYETNDYEDVYYDENYSQNLCFIVGEEQKTEDGILFTTEVKMVCTGLVNTFDGVVGTLRGDSVVVRGVTSALRAANFDQLTITGITMGVENVFKGFDIKKLRTFDMQPNACFSINFDLEYYLTKKCAE